MGTAHVLDALRGQLCAKVLVVVTTDKVYQNNETGTPFREQDALGGHDPYSASKAGAEMLVASYRESFLRQQGLAVASARAGNVIGGGDWAQDRLIPDAMRAWNAGQALQIRRPNAIRPWQHVLEPLAGYLRLAERLWSNPALAGAFNFGPTSTDAATVRAVVEQARQAWGFGAVQYGDGTQGPHEAHWLALDASKARQQLGIVPRWGLQESVWRTVDWYKRAAQGEAARTLCLDQIELYESACGASGVVPHSAEVPL